MAVSTSNVIGVALGNVDTSPVFNLGTTVNLDDGGQAVYVQAASAVSAYNAVAVRADGTANNLTTTNSAECKRVGFAQVSIASGSYGWVQTGGKVRVNLLTLCQDFVPLYTTATEGALDDATVSGGLVAGLVAVTSAPTGGSACTCVAGYPHVASGVTANST